MGGGRDDGRDRWSGLIKKNGEQQQQIRWQQQRPTLPWDISSMMDKPHGRLCLKGCQIEGTSLYFYLYWMEGLMEKWREEVMEKWMEKWAE